MTKKSSSLLLIFCLALIANLTPVFSQAPDTVLVPSAIDGNPLGAINATIQGDTTATGERNNPNRVYQLERGKVYLLDGVLVSEGYDLQIIGQQEPKDTRPAVLMPGVLEDGSVPAPMLEVYGDLTLKDIYIISCANNGSYSSWPSVAIYTDSVEFSLDNCIIEANDGIIFNFLGTMANILATNNYWRNCLSPSSWYNGGRALWIENALADTVIIVNNTWANSGCYFYTDRDRGTNYLKIEHNTICNSAGFVFFLHNMTNASISNNIFYNPIFAGEDGHAGAELLGGWNDTDGMAATIISVDTLSGGNLKIEMEEADRNISIKNNAYFWQPEVQAAWTTYDSLVPPAWMNSRTVGMFADDATWPGLVDENNLNQDPGFVVAPTVIDSIAKFIETTKTWAGISDFRFPVGKDVYMPDWPIPEDLAYTNDALLEAADGGRFPIGDLNWFPDEKEAWEDWVETDVDDDVKQPSSMVLAQNYPNPFNPSTSIEYTLNHNSQITLEVYNVLGQKVRTLFNGVAVAGNYTATWHGIDDAGFTVGAGVYFYKLSNGNETITHKMLFVK